MCRQHSTCTAKASFSSIKSRSPIVKPARRSALVTAGTGPVPISAGSTPATAVDRTRTKGCRPSRRAVSSDMTSRAAAPSLRGELLPAVTVPWGGKKAASQRGQLVESGVAWHALIDADQKAPPLLVVAVHAHQFVLELAGLVGGGSPPMAFQGQFILLAP